MRTTLAIEDDVLAAARSLAAMQRKSLGEVISSLARQALQPHAAGKRPSTRNGVPLLPLRKGVSRVTPALVNELRDELP